MSFHLTDQVFFLAVRIQLNRGIKCIHLESVSVFPVERRFGSSVNMFSIPDSLLDMERRLQHAALIDCTRYDVRTWNIPCHPVIELSENRMVQIIQ